MRSLAALALLLSACNPSVDPTGATDGTDGTDATDDTEDTDVVVESPWKPLEDLPTGGAWPAVGVVGTVIHVVPSNSREHYVYDTATDSGWSTVAKLPEPAHYHAGAGVDGYFMVIGGGSPGAIDSVDWTYFYDPGDNQWSLLAPMPTPRGYVNSAVVGTEVFLIGGPNVSGETWNRTVEAYDVRTNGWRKGELLPPGTMWPLYSAMGVVDGKIYKIAGGIAQSPLAIAYAYDVAEDDWKPVATAPVRNHGPAGAALGRSVYMIGGYVNLAVSDQVWRYDVDSDSYTQEAPLHVPVAYAKAVAVGDCLYVIGGHDNANPDVATTFARWCPGT